MPLVLLDTPLEEDSVASPHPPNRWAGTAATENQ